MAGWVPTDAAAWLRDRESIPGPWPEVLVVTDLRFWADPKACGGRTRPSLRVLGEVWGWSKSRVERFVGATDAWADPMRAPEERVGHQRDTRGTPVGQPRDTGPSNEADDSPPAGQPRDTGGTLVGQQRDTPLGSRARTPHPTPSTQEEVSSLRSETECQAPAPDPASKSDPVPGWAKGLALPAGVSRREVADLVVEVRDHVLGKPMGEGSAGSAAKVVLALWKARGSPLLSAFREELLLVVQAAKDCPDPRFARDVRAEGWAEGRDRSRDLATLCRIDRFDARLDTAQRWRDAGFPTSITPPARASPPARAAPSGRASILSMFQDDGDDTQDADFTVEQAC